MRIATYNIKSGGFTSYSSSLDQPERLALLQEAIKQINADVIGLVDTFRWKDLYTTDKLSALFGYEYSFHIDIEDERVDKRIGLALLSKSPLKESQIIRIHNRNCISTKIVVEERVVNIFCIYLDDLKEQVRWQQVQSLAKIVNRQFPTIILGDLNAITPSEVSGVQDTLRNVLASHPHIKEILDKNITYTEKLEQLYQVKALPFLYEQGFHDPGLKHSQPTVYSALSPFSIKMPMARIDYILHSANISSADFITHTDSLFDQSSDHYPVSVDISFL